MVITSAILIMGILCSAISFLFFGYSCLTSPFMVSEFKRYGLGTYRRLTGCLQILGALTLLGGLFYLPFTIIGSAGLSILMWMGFAVRIRIRDSLIQSTPALFYAVLNMVILFTALQDFD